MILTFIFCYHNYQPDLWYINISRILQLAELFKLQSYQRAVKVISNTLLQTYKTFFFLYWFVMLLVIVYGAIMFTVERGTLTVNNDYPDGEYLRWNIARTEKEPTPFTSLAASMWYTLVSITTVGYGDMVPTSILGRAFGASLLLISFLIVALPITVIGEAFANAVDEYNQEKIKNRVSSAASTSHLELNSSSHPSTRQTLHSLETLLRESLVSNEDKGHLVATTMNPLRRSFLRRPTNHLKGAFSCHNHEMRNNEISPQDDEDERAQQQLMSQWVDYFQKNQIPSLTRELLELQFELFQNHSKRKEIEKEYFEQLQLLNESELALSSKIQQLMTQKVSGDGEDENNKKQMNGNGEVKSDQRTGQSEMQSFEIQS
jgi:hypothetical protein